jgi:hypothetical protein
MNKEIYNSSRRDFLKGVAIGAGGCALGASLIHPKEVMGQSIEGYMEKVPMETRWDLVSGAYITTSINYYNLR